QRFFPSVFSRTTPLNRNCAIWICNGEMFEDTKSIAARWKSVQNELSRSRIAADDLQTFSPIDWSGLQLVAGVDVSFFEGTMEAIGCVAVLSFPELTVVHECIQRVTLTEPYIPGFLAFREYPVIMQMLDRIKRERPEVYPQVLFVDGNGTLHPEFFGLACHVGVLANLPSIGIGKNFLEIRDEALLMDDVKRRAKTDLPHAGAWFPLVGSATGRVFGAAVRATKDSVNPVFVSPGHRVSVDTAVRLTLAVSKFRVPEPIRMADGASRREVAAS
ncbi:endonuclease V-domain-containing protein, partial [Zopfochytrium polystomum]